MPTKKIDPDTIEQNEYRIFDPSKVKNTVEIAEKPKPNINDLTTIEKPGKKIIKKPATKRKTATKKKTTTKRKTTKKAKKPEKKELKLTPKALKKDGPVLIVTEKPQAASKIAAALAEGKDKKIMNGKVAYHEFERNGRQIIVSCAVGHLFSVSQNIKGTDYPIFDIGWYKNSDIKRGRDFTKQYHDTIKKLVLKAGEIVIATDFDVEGEVIGYNVMRFIANQKDAKRMKFSQLTPNELQNSFDNRQDHIEWGQAIAGETRHFLDWLYGINLSRALMNSIKTTGKFSVMSIGRVQGPALKLIVDKEKVIEKFVPTPYWQIYAKIIDKKNQTIELKHNKDITKEKELEKFDKLVGKKAECETKKTDQIIQPPAPFDLTTLQTEMYKFHGITPSNTLIVAQKLYLAGIISYPRTSSQKIPEEIKPLEIIKKLKKNGYEETEHVTRKTPIEGNKTDPAHPAITPTGITKRLDGYDEKVYNLIVKRFISCFCDDVKLTNKRIEMIIDKLKFATKGMEILKKGWMNVYPTKMEEKEIPTIDGEVDITKIRNEKKETKPPKRYSPASIITDLEKRNLGTKATRSNILETLYNRNYIKDKSIKATDLGIRLINCLEEYSPVIIEEKLTREIEKDMENIRNSKKDLEKKKETTLKKAQKALEIISKDFKKNEVKIGKVLRDANEKAWEQEKEDAKLLPCPECKKGELAIKYTPRFKSYFVACTSYPDCKKTFSLPSQSIIKKTDKICEDCNYPMLLRLKQGKRPWVFCFNPNCPSRKPLDIDGNTKTETKRYTGEKQKEPTKKIEKIK